MANRAKSVTNLRKSLTYKRKSPSGAIPKGKRKKEVYAVRGLPRLVYEWSDNRFRDLVRPRLRVVLEGDGVAVRVTSRRSGLAVSCRSHNGLVIAEIPIESVRVLINDGELGELAIIRVCHMTPGLAPGEGHEYEGPCFHDCGMHYVDIARWYAGSEYATWHAQGMRMWDYKDPWWVQCHGTFENGVVFDITQGFVYGQLSKDQTHNSYIDLIGTKGIVRMRHDFKTAEVDLHGVTRTELIKRPFGGKNIDALVDRFADSIESGKLDPHLPTMRDSAIASEAAWTFLEDSRKHTLPSIGDEQTLEQIRERRRTMTNGYGLLHRRD